jgi:hypothetical protein
MRLEGLGQLKNPMTLSGTEPATFRLVAWCLNQLCYRVPLWHTIRTEAYDETLLCLSPSLLRTETAQNIVCLRSDFVCSTAKVVYRQITG